MSFSSDVKEELAKQVSKSRHCQLADYRAGRFMMPCAESHLRVNQNFILRSQTAGAKFRGQKENSPDRQLRSQRYS